MDALVAAYADPRGTFDAQSVDEVVAFVTGVLQDFSDLGVDDRINTLFADANDNVDVGDPGAQPQGDVELSDGSTIRIEGEGFFEVERICDGWGASPVADPKNGTLSLNVNVTDVSVDPVVWLTANACQYKVDDVPVRMGAGSRRDVGDVRIYVGDNLSLEDLGTTPIIVEVDVGAAVDPQGADDDPIGFDVSFAANGDLAIRVPVSDGDVVVGTSASAIVNVRAGNGSFTCDFSGGCDDGQGNSVQLP
jgi:hypothetical protein